MLKPYICTQCGRPYDPFEEWFYWPEDSGHEACLKRAEAAFAQWLQSEENMQHASEGAPTTLAQAYEQEGSPPVKMYASWQEALNEIAYVQASELIHQLTQAAMPHMEPTDWRTERPWVGEGAIARVVLEQFMNVGIAEITRSAEQYGAHYASHYKTKPTKKKDS